MRELKGGLGIESRGLKPRLARLQRKEEKEACGAAEMAKGSFLRRPGAEAAVGSPTVARQEKPRKRGWKKKKLAERQELQKILF
jgi:hypothetical protein